MSSKRRIRRNACRGKKRHDSAEAARKAMNGLIHAYRGAIGLLKVYQCPFCGGWRFGHARSPR